MGFTLEEINMLLELLTVEQSKQVVKDNEVDIEKYETIKQKLHVLTRNFRSWIACFVGQGSRWKYMRINLFDGTFKFDFDWKAVVGIGIIILGCALLTMWGVVIFERNNKENMGISIWNFYMVRIFMDGSTINSMCLYITKTRYYNFDCGDCVYFCSKNI